MREWECESEKVRVWKWEIERLTEWVRVFWFPAFVWHSDIFLGQPLSRLSAGSIQWYWKQTRFVLDIISYYRIPWHSVPYINLFEINKRDISEGLTFKKFDHTLVELSDNGIYQKVQPLKSSTSSEDELAIPIGNKVTWMVLKLLQKHLRFQGK